MIKFVDKDPRRERKRETIKGIVNNFIDGFAPLEKECMVMIDYCTKAFYIETYLMNRMNTAPTGKSLKIILPFSK